MTALARSARVSPGASTPRRLRTATARSTRCAPWPSRASSAATGWSPRSCSATRARPRRHGAERQQPAGLDAVAGPAVLDLPDARGLLPGRRLLGGPRLPRRVPPLAAQAHGPAGPPGRGAGRGLGSGHGRHVPGGRPGRDRAHAPVPGHQPAVVPGRVRRADRADPGGPGAGPAVRRVGGGLPGRPWWPSPTWFGSACPGRPGSGWVNVAAGWLVPYLLGIAWALGVAARPPGPRADAGRRRRRHRRADRLGRVPGQHGRRERSPHLEPEPAHAGRGDLRDRPVRPGPAAARPAGAADAPPPGLGRRSRWSTCRR